MRIVMAVILALGLVNSAQAGPREDAKVVLEALGGVKLLQVTIDSSESMARAAINGLLLERNIKRAAQGKRPISVEERERITKHVWAEVRADYLDNAMEEFLTSYVLVYTPAELAAAVEFLQTEHGRAFFSKQPGAQAMSRMRTRPIGDRAMKRALGRLEEAFPEIDW